MVDLYVLVSCTLLANNLQMTDVKNHANVAMAENVNGYCLFADCLLELFGHDERTHAAAYASLS